MGGLYINLQILTCEATANAVVFGGVGALCSSLQRLEDRFRQFLRKETLRRFPIASVTCHSALLPPL